MTESYITLNNAFHVKENDREAREDRQHTKEEREAEKAYKKALREWEEQEKRDEREYRKELRARGKQEKLEELAYQRALRKLELMLKDVEVATSEVSYLSLKEKLSPFSRQCLDSRSNNTSPRAHQCVDRPRYEEPLWFDESSQYSAAPSQNEEASQHQAAKPRENSRRKTSKQTRDAKLKAQ